MHILSISKLYLMNLTILVSANVFAQNNVASPLPAATEKPSVVAPNPVDGAKTTNFSPGISSSINNNFMLDKKNNNDADMVQAQAVILNELPTRLVMYVGQMSLIKVPSVSRVAVGNGKVITANMVDTRTLLVTAMDAGDSTLHVWNKAGTPVKVKVRVNIADNERTIEELRDLTSNISNVSIRRVGERVVISGNNLDQGAVERINTLAKLYPNTVNLASADRIRTDRMVDIQVKFMEFNKNALDSLGVQWQNIAEGFSFGLFSDISTNGKYRTLPPGSNFSSSAGGYPGADLSRTSGTYLGLATSLTSKLNLLVQRGSAFVLASPNLTTRSGGEAKFLAGGEIPLPSISSTGAGSVSFKSYGVLLNIKPTADAQGNIAGSILTEVSNIDRSVAVQGIPGLSIRRTDTEFNVIDGETIVLSGFIGKETSNDSSGLPGLRKLPFFGKLFRSDNENDKETEVVIFITPRIVDASNSKQRVEKMLQKQQENQEVFSNLIDGEKKPVVPIKLSPNNWPASPDNR